MGLGLYLQTALKSEILWLHNLTRRYGSQWSCAYCSQQNSASIFLYTKSHTQLSHTHTHTQAHTHTPCVHTSFSKLNQQITPKKTITFQNSPQICQMYFLNLWFSFPWRRNSEPYSCFAFASTPRRWCGAFPDSLPVITPQVHLLPWANSYIISPFPPYNQKKHKLFLLPNTR